MSMHLSPPEADELQALFEDEGARVEAGGDRSFLLDSGRAWRVETGRVDVFLVRVREGAPAGGRRHLARVEAGETLFSVAPEGGFALLAAGTLGTRLLALSTARLQGAGSGLPHPAGVAGAMERWVAALCAGLVHGLAPRRSDDLEPGAERVLEAGASLQPGGAVWVRHLAGSTLLLGDATLPLGGDGAVPLAGPAWLTAEAPARVRALAAAPPAPEAWAGLERLHRLVLRAAAARAQRDAAAELEKARRRDVRARGTLARATARLASVLDGRRQGASLQPRAADGDEEEDALLAAVRLVGGALGVEVRPSPVRAPGAGPLGAIARASRLRVRRVMLRGDWWRHDGGPLLGYAGEEKRPVALLPDGATRYVLCDPARPGRERVDEALAGTLAPFGHMLYRPFPNERLGALDVLRFGACGNGRDIAMVLGMGAAGALLAMAGPMATGLLYNSVIPGAERGQLLQLTLVLLAVAGAGVMFHLARALALTRIEGKMGSVVQAAAWDRLISLPATFFRGWSAGDLAVRAMGIDAIRQALSGAAVTGALSLLFAGFYLALLFHYSPPLAWRAALLAGMALVATVSVSSIQLRNQRAISRLQARISGMVLQFLTGISKLRVAAAEVEAFGLWAERFAEQRRLRYRVRRAGTALAAFNGAFPVLAYLAIFAAAAPMARGEDGLRTGDFLAFMAAFAGLLASTLALSQAAFALMEAVPQYEQARPILEATPEFDAARADPGPLTGEISLRHLSFRYAEGAARVLNDLSLELRVGEFVALVGPSGSGKSTLVRLLLGFETPELGGIYFDGQELGGLDLASVRRQVGVVLQNGRLMPGDLFTNIVGSSPATLEDAWEAARMAGLEADIRAMPMGMHTVVSEGGTTLSGGQRQRLMIARAIVNRPRILLFDEATSALDNRTQAIVSESLARLRATRLVIAHRLSTIVHADRICVLRQGTIVQSGTYDELMAVEGPFAELARRQIA